MLGRVLLRLQILLLVLMVAAVIAFRSEWVLFASLATAFAVSAIGLLALALVALLALCWSFVGSKSAPRSPLVVCVAIAALPIASILVTVGPAGFKVPPIHDISTDLSSPPQFTVVPGLRHESDNSLIHAGESLAQQQRAAYPHIQPLAIALSPEESYERSRAALQSLGWELVSDSPERLELEAVEASLLFGFKDDVIVRIRGTESGSVVDVRSVSRVGRSDLGANAKRIERFFEALGNQS